MITISITTDTTGDNGVSHRDNHSLTVNGNQLILSDTAGIDVAEFTRVSAVPVPAAVWLFGSGFLGLVGVARRKNA